MMQALVRALFGRLVRLYYPTLSVTGAERFPVGAPVLAVLNHPNGLLDPLVLRYAIGRPVRFLGKSTLFGNHLGRLAMESFGALPVYRQRDVGEGGASTSRNEETFALCRECLARGDWIALFPEGTSHSDPVMKPLKTGAARIALSTVAEKPDAAGLVVLPMGLFYTGKAVFRSEALVVVGQGIPVAERLESYRIDERAAVDALTDEIRAGLDRVVLQAETRDLLEGIARVAGIVAGERRAGGQRGIADHFDNAQKLLDAYSYWKKRDPARVERVTAAAREFFDVLDGIGVSDPWALEAGEVTAASAVKAGLGLVAMAPLALAGVFLGWIPYRLAGRLARKVSGAEDELGTVKLLAGALLVLVFWLVEASLAAWRLGYAAGVAVMVLAPLGGYFALRFEEKVARARGVVRLWRLRRDHAEVARSVVERRRTLIDEIHRALEERV